MGKSKMFHDCPDQINKAAGFAALKRFFKNKFVGVKEKAKTIPFPVFSRLYFFKKNFVDFSIEIQ